MTIKKWSELDRKTVFSKFGRSVQEVTYELPGGEIADYFVKSERDAVCIFALDDEERVLLARQFRAGPMAVLDELPGGYIDHGESPLQAAKRELEEETGLTGKLELVGMCLDDAYSTTKRYCFVATQLRPSSKQLSTSEDIELRKSSIDDFRRLLRTGRMTDVEMGYMALDYLDRL